MSNGDSDPLGISGGGDVGATPPFLPSAGGAPTQQSGAMQQFLNVLRAAMGHKGIGQMFGAGQKGGPRGSQPAQVGQQIPGAPPPAMAGQPTPHFPIPPPQQGTGPGSGMSAPAAAVPGREGYSPTGTEGQFMSQLNPQGAAVFQGLQGLQSAIQRNQQRKDQQDSAEAANVAQNLMKALDVAQNSQDPRAKAEAMQTVDMILKNKEYSKVINKVYKGWLQKADQQKKQKGQEPDPETAGFEGGLQAYFQGKQAQPPQMPANLQGYRLPSAGPAQQIGNISAQEQTKRAVADPKTQMPSQLSSQEMLETERGATVYKTQAEIAEAQSRMAIAHSNLLLAGKKVEEEQAKLQVEQAKTKYAEATGKKAVQIKDIDYQRALVNLDIWRAKLQLAKLPKSTGHPPPQLTNKIAAGQQALDYLDMLLKDPERAKKGFNVEDVTRLQAWLGQMGAAALYKDLPDALHRHLPEMMGGTGSEAVNTMRNAIQGEMNGLSTVIQQTYPKWEGLGSAKSQGGELPDAGEFGLPPGFEEGDSEGGDVTKTPEQEIGLPPGFEPIPEKP